MKSWKTTVSGVGALVCQVLAIFLPPEYASKCAQAGAVFVAFGLMAARDNNVTSEQAGAGSRGGLGQTGTNPTSLPYLQAIALGFVVLLGSGCVWGGSAVKTVRALAKDPATWSVRVRLVTPWGTEEVDYSRAGGTNYSTAGSGNVTVGLPPKKASD